MGSEENERPDEAQRSPGDAGGAPQRSPDDAPQRSPADKAQRSSGDAGGAPQRSPGDEAQPSGGEASPTREAPTLMARRSVWRLVLLTLLIGFAVTATLTVLSRSVFEHEQNRLLNLRARDAGAILSEALPGIQTPLASGAELADATGGDLSKFRTFIAPYVGSRPPAEFVSVSLWSLKDPQRGPLTVVGARPQLLSSGISQAAFFRRAAQSKELVVVGLLKGSTPRIGYGFTTPNSTSGYAAYAESMLPASRYQPVPPGSPFAGFDFAIYLGHAISRAQLLTASPGGVPAADRTVVKRVPFGNSAFTLVLGTSHSLSGSLPQDLPWIIAGGGAFISLLAALVTFGLAVRRRHAERLALQLEAIAAENRRLYSEQRTIAQTLQHALLPDKLPSRQHFQTQGRYVPSESSVDIGGDWYDVIERSERSLLLVVGDVSGHGLQAATTMAALRFATHAYAAQGDSPEEILGKLTGMISVSREGHLATVLCAQIDLDTDELTFCTAGHLPPLLLHDGEARYLEAKTGLPVGVDRSATYTSSKVRVPGGGTLVAFTDGLVERRGENLDLGLDRVRAAALGQDPGLERLVGKLLSAGPAAEGLDDIAIVAVRWKS